MWECPVLVRSDDSCALLICPHPEAKYTYWLAGDWQNGFVSEHRRGKLDLGAYAYAAQCLHDPMHDRHLLWTWIKEGRSAAAQRAAGWSGLLSLPKECGLNDSGNLVVKPAAELVSLRAESRSIEGQRLTPLSKDPFLGFEGDCLEVEVEFSFEEPTICELSVRASPDQEERTTIIYDSDQETLTVDGSRSSLDPDVDHPTVSGRLGPDARRSGSDSCVPGPLRAGSVSGGTGMHHPTTVSDARGKFRLEFQGEEGFGNCPSPVHLEIGSCLAECRVQETRAAE